MITLIALRLGIGWHFFKEGAKKFQGDSFTSVYFLQTAKGPLAEFYKSMIPDRQGYERLDQGKTEEFWQAKIIAEILFVAPNNKSLGTDCEG